LIAAQCPDNIYAFMVMSTAYFLDINCSAFHQ
jgi:hypothetical protein